MSGPNDLTDRIIGLLPRLRRFALTLTRHPDDADDLVQASVERALTRLDHWKENTRLDSWMFKIMQNLWFDQIRARKVRGVEAPEAELAELPGRDGRADMDARLTLSATLEEVMRLPEDQRSLVLLVIVEGFSYRDAAEVLGVPIGTVMSRIARARLALEGKVFGEGRPPLTVVRQ